MKPEGGVRPKNGFTLVEMIIAGLLMAIMAGGLSAMGMYSASQVKAARADIRIWAAMQRVTDSLTSLTAAGITAGSTTVEGRTIAWAVADTTPPARVRVVAYGGSSATDTTNIYLPIR